jgi:hypothetical protein
MQTRAPLSDRKALSLTLAATLAFFAAGARADVQDIKLTYEVTTSIDQPIETVITLNTYVNGSGMWWPSSVGAGGGLIDDPFTKSSENRPLTGLILGLTSNLPGDAAGQKHVVMGLDSGAAAGLQNIAWGTTFTAYTEEAIANDIYNVAGISRAADGTPEAAIWDAAINELGAFANDTTGGAGQLWFKLAVTQPGETKTSNFSVMAWTDGQQIGTGVATVTQAVPEPESYALGLAGLGVAGLMLRRRKNA